MVLPVRRPTELRGCATGCRIPLTAGCRFAAKDDMVPIPNPHNWHLMYSTVSLLPSVRARSNPGVPS